MEKFNFRFAYFLVLAIQITNAFATPIIMRSEFDEDTDGMKRAWYMYANIASRTNVKHSSARTGRLDYQRTSGSPQSLLRHRSLQANKARQLLLLPQFFRPRRPPQRPRHRIRRQPLLLTPLFHPPRPSECPRHLIRRLTNLRMTTQRATRRLARMHEFRLAPLRNLAHRRVRGVRNVGFEYCTSSPGDRGKVTWKDTYDDSPKADSKYFSAPWI